MSVGIGTDGTAGEKIIATVPKNARERVVVVLHSYRGHELLGLKVQWRAHEDDEWKWSAKGFSIRTDRAPELAAAIVRAVKAISPTWRPAA